MRRRDALKLGLGAAAGAASAATWRLGGLERVREQRNSRVAHVRLSSIDLELAPGIEVRSLAFDATVPGPLLTRDSMPTAVALRNESDGDTVVHSSAFAQPWITLPAHSVVRTMLRQPDADAEGFHLQSYRAYDVARGTVAGGSVAGGSVARGSVAGGSVARGSVARGSVAGAITGGAAGAITGSAAAGIERGGTSLEFDQLQVLSVHRWPPRCVLRADTCRAITGDTEYVSFNDALMSASEPVKVRGGDRVRFHFANTSTARGVTFGLPQHRFLVVALDGHPVPTPRLVERVYLGPAETVDALVTMNRPGRWILGATHRDDRAAGLGRLVEYAGATGHAVAGEYGIAPWDYAGFGCNEIEAKPRGSRDAATPLASTPWSIQLVRGADPTSSHLDPTPLLAPIAVAAGRRYRVVTTNLTPEPQSLQLLGQTVELTRVAGRRTAGVIKDIITLPSFTRIEFEFDARTNEVMLVHNRQASLVESPPRV